MYFHLVLPGYNDTEQENNQECPKGQYFMQNDTEGMSKKACRFRRGILSQCSGLSDTNFGYSEGQPCVLLKMNRVTLTFRHRFCLKKPPLCVPLSFNLFFPPRQLLICLVPPFH